MPEFLPIELVFNPHWWHQTAGISFDRKFYLDPQTRIQNDRIMRQVLYQRYGNLGLGEANPQPRPIIGSSHVAGGFFLPALLGMDIRFSPDAAPVPVPNQSDPWIMEFSDAIDFLQTWPMNELTSQMDNLEKEFGAVVGDVDLDGVLNTALHVYGESLYSSFFDRRLPLTRFLEMVARLMVAIGLYIRNRTGTCALATNRMVAHVAPGMFLHSNCSVQMISPFHYGQMMLPIEKWMAEHIQPYGIHHCGNNMQQYAASYAKTGATFYDVGWGSDVQACRQALPDAFFSLRLSPVRMLQCDAHQIAQDTEALLKAAGSLENVGMCCINMDCGTPDDNIFAMAEVVQRYRQYGA